MKRDFFVLLLLCLSLTAWGKKRNSSNDNVIGADVHLGLTTENDPQLHVGANLNSRLYLVKKGQAGLGIYLRGFEYDYTDFDEDHPYRYGVMVYNYTNQEFHFLGLGPVVSTYPHRKIAIDAYYNICPYIASHHLSTIKPHGERYEGNNYGLGFSNFFALAFRYDRFKFGGEYKLSYGKSVNWGREWHNKFQDNAIRIFIGLTLGEL